MMIMPIESWWPSPWHLRRGFLKFKPWLLSARQEHQLYDDDVGSVFDRKGKIFHFSSIWGCFLFRVLPQVFDFKFWYIGYLICSVSILKGSLDSLFNLSVLRMGGEFVSFRYVLNCYIVRILHIWTAVMNSYCCALCRLSVDALSFVLRNYEQYSTSIWSMQKQQFQFSDC